MEPDIKLYYFDARGLGEISRLVLALAGQKYQDIRWSKDDWPKYKSEAPFGQGPFLVYNGKKIGQSAAVACFLAREFGKYGTTSWAAAVTDQIIHIYRDLLIDWQKVLYEQDETKKAEFRKKLREEDLPKFFGHFNKLLEEQNCEQEQKSEPKTTSGLFNGDSITLADLYLYDVMYQMKAVEQFDAGAMFPKLKALYEKVDANPQIKAYVSQRPESKI